MKDYKRLTKPSSDYPIGGILYCRLKDLEDKIERGEIDYVADKDKEIARLTEENERLSKQLTDGKCVYLSDSETAEGCVQSPCPNYKTVEDILKENAELKARLEKAVELKANVGDTIYCIHGISNPTITDWEVKEIRITDHNYIVICGHSGTNDRRVEVSEHYKKWWFTDRAKAEARLAELKGGEGE